MINFTPFSAPSGLTSKNAITILYGCFPFSLFAASLRGQTLEVILYNRSMPDKRDVKNCRVNLALAGAFKFSSYNGTI